MTLELWLAFVAATTLLLVMPGPTILLVVSYALGSGRQSAWWTVPGVALGDFTALILSLAGLGAILAASAEAFTLLKWLGAAYLVFLGVKMWRSQPSLEAAAAAPRKGRGIRIMGHAYIVTALNPKGMIFFLAFLPQFIAPSQPVAPQLFLLGATFLLLATINAVAYALLAGSLRARIARPATLKLVNRLGGGVLIAAGAMMAGLRRASA